MAPGPGHGVPPPLSRPHDQHAFSLLCARIPFNSRVLAHPRAGLTLILRLPLTLKQPALESGYSSRPFDLRLKFNSSLNSCGTSRSWSRVRVPRGLRKADISKDLPARGPGPKYATWLNNL